ncbi:MULTISPECIES: dicarboxylate/amino acid:cation symporter [unclassified Sphingomonas]|uniref:dicarboxylate/amino acid:cation symporter n=1 Tax=unclassified Sphingomonas TaxID=196159 RepID=UPI0006F34FC6|nr:MULTISPECIES: dicarboxylate/amino acid:cation symporter [unclassified Sphingomonas]KQM59957.1 sodium:dicarboxylate symporter [Sphingomonas sp. Leaf16]KQN11355.1 sodium:dicarboxylate symporter [Sphingomonas sp. Leaf29]KQN18677.1 sodium:dicarboxylate symporter [Sphingomonas sp. Leaf32]
MRRWFAIPLWQRVVAALFLGVAIGLLWPDGAAAIKIIGDLFVRCIKMLVVPVVLITIAAGIASLGDPRRLGGIGGRTVALFAFTTLIAVTVGMALGLLLQPGSGIALAGVAPHVLGPPVTPADQLLGIVPLNIVDALAKGDMLAIIFVAVLLGIASVVSGEAGKPVVALLQGLSAVLLHLVRIVMEVTPFGVLALIANAVAGNGLAVFVNVGWLALCVILGTLAQMAFHAGLLRFVAKLPVVRFFRGIVDALIVAFSTASSSATLPVALRVSQDNLGIARPIASTVLPLGASIGKDGTAMYVGLLGQFALQALGIVPDGWMLGVMLATGALAAFGTAPVPSASLFMLAAMLGAVGVGAEQTALVVGLVLPFDRLLDMTRTVASASANLTVATLVARAEDGLDEARYRGQTAT